MSSIAFSLRGKRPADGTKLLESAREESNGRYFGSGGNEWDFLSVENAAEAHLLLALALNDRLVYGVDSSRPKVDGEAFNITDGERHKFWDYPHLIWEAAGWQRPVEFKPLRLAPGLLRVIASIIELLCWIFSLGQKLPTTFTRQEIAYACFEHTYQIEKAKQRLGYDPGADFKGGVQKAVRWCLENAGWAERLEKRKIQVKKKV